ncbi:MAG: glycine cleavage system protein GcvH [Planctomycetes bacterium]|nr:glycine cleavage system protein GcvH [Planctomycetota bacterium]
MANENMRFLDSHEWARQEEDLVVIGLSDYAVEQLGDIVYLELPSVGDNVNKSAEFGSLESVKAACDLYAPISGEIVEINESLPDEPELFKSDPFGQAWMIKVKPSDLAQLDELMDAAAYAEHVKGQ